MTVLDFGDRIEIEGTSIVADRFLKSDGAGVVGWVVRDLRAPPQDPTPLATKPEARRAALALAAGLAAK